MRLLNAETWFIALKKAMSKYMPRDSHTQSWLNIDPDDRVDHNPPPAFQRLSEEWDKDLKGLIPDPIVKIRIKVIMKMDKWDPNHLEDNEGKIYHNCNAHTPPAHSELFEDITWINC